jgi:hypothetical protein
MVDESVGGTTMNQQDLADLQTLITSAFEQTRSTGRADWAVMTVPVLKNRLLNLTDRQFTETTYGASSMSELIALIPDLVELDSASRPPRVRLRHSAERVAVVPHSRYQIRRDLWNAVVDFGRGEAYVWSGSAAVPESEYTGAAPPKVLPTLTRDEEMGWRTDFLTHLDPQLGDRDRDRVELWLERQLSTRVLPVEVQGRWSDYLKSRIVDRLRQWFRANGMREPADLLYLGVPRPADGGSESFAVDELRALVIRCVQNMTFEELCDLRLPARVLLRTRG